MQYFRPGHLFEASAPRGVEAIATPRRIALFGNFGSQNLGNEASFEAVRQMLSAHLTNSDVVSICRYPDRVRERYGVPAYPLTRQKFSNRWVNRLDRLCLRVPSTLRFLAGAWRQTRRLDVIVVPGTGLLDDFGERPSQMPFELFAWSAIAFVNRRPLALVSIGAGPIRNRLSRTLMASAAWLASYRSYRDVASKKFVASLGIEVAKDEVYPDIVFSLSAPHRNTAQAAQDRLTIGVGVMSYYGWQPGAEDGQRTYEGYVGKLTRFVLWLIGRGYRVRLLIGSQADTAVVREITERVTAETDLPDAALISDPAETLNDLMVQICDTDIVVATRFHNVVAALKCGKPILSLGYADKNMHLLREFGLESFSQPVESIDFDLLVRQFEALVLERQQIGERIEAGVARLRGSLQQQQARLLTEIISSSRA